jgi:RNA polymerase sigma factor (sigma-70 family)
MIRFDQKLGERHSMTVGVNNPNDFHSEESFEDLLNQAKQGDQRALSVLLGNTHQYLLKIANDRVPGGLRGATAPSDFVQDALLALGKAVDRFEGTEHGWRAYARTILINSIKRAVNGTKSNDQLPNEVPKKGDGPGTSVSKREIQQEFKRIREQMKPEYQRVLELRDQRLPWTAIGEAMQRTPEAVRKLWCRAWFDFTDRATENGLLE